MNLVNPKSLENLTTPRWPKGTSGNPGGRKKYKPFEDAYRKLGELPASELTESEKDSAIVASVKSTYRQAIQGSVRAVIEAADRTEGRVPLPLMTPEGGEFVLNLVSHIPRPNRHEKPQKKKKRSDPKVN